MSTTGSRRLVKELRAYLEEVERREQSGEPGLDVEIEGAREIIHILNENKAVLPQRLAVRFLGPAERGLYAGGVWRGHVEVSADYPFSSLRVCVTSALYSFHGAIPVGEGDRYSPVEIACTGRDGFTPIDTLLSVLDRVWSHVTDPEEEPHWSNSRMAVFRSDRALYNRQARLHTLLHATPVCGISLFELLLLSHPPL